MCGRYYMDEETYLDIQKIVSEVEVSFGRELITGDIHPTEAAPVIVSPAYKKLQLCKKAWGILNGRIKASFLMPGGIGDRKKNVSKWNPLSPDRDSCCRIL